MSSLRQHFSIDFTYDVHFTEHVFQEDNTLLADTIEGEPRPKKIGVVVDEGLLAHHEDLLHRMTRYAAAHAEVMRLAAAPLVVPGGEAAKNDPALVRRLHEAIYEMGLDRHAYLLAGGGGAVLDLAGYAAATAHRGIRHVRVPTTVLSQNDSGVGVKNGVNAFGTKNFTGTFAPPCAVLNDATFLTTLDDRDWRSGIAEAVKVALLKDAGFFAFIAGHAEALAPPRREMEPMKQLVYRCAEWHLRHIATSGDPFEWGTSRPLDFGHWAAHKLEQLTDYTLRHGEAVAVGLALDCTYAHLTGRLDTPDWQRVLNVLSAVGFPLYVPELEMRLDAPEHPESPFHGLTEFREHLGGELTIMLLERIGRGVEVHEVDLEVYREAISLLRERAGEAAGVSVLDDRFVSNQPSATSDQLKRKAS